MKAAIYNRKTLADLLVSAAKANPDKGVFFVRSEGSARFISFSGLLSLAVAIA